MIRLLIVAQYIAPTQSIASIRWTKLAKYLHQTGAYQISVLTNEKHYHSDDGNAASKDALLEKEMGVFLRYNVIPDSDALTILYAQVPPQRIPPWGSRRQCTDRSFCWQAYNV